MELQGKDAACKFTVNMKMPFRHPADVARRTHLAGAQLRRRVCGCYPWA
jgi:hypothetical protein